MKLVKSIKYLNRVLDRYRSDGFKIHLTPTMGALHAGHLKLVKRSKKLKSIVVVSIFVNPTQFGPKEDYKNYPRTLKNDLKVLKKYPEKMPSIFFKMFKKNSPDTVIKFLSNKSNFFEDLSIILKMPKLTFLRALFY